MRNTVSKGSMDRPVHAPVCMISSVRETFVSTSAPACMHDSTLSRLLHSSRLHGAISDCQRAASSRVRYTCRKRSCRKECS